MSYLASVVSPLVECKTSLSDRTVEEGPNFESVHNPCVKYYVISFNNKESAQRVREDIARAK